MSPLFIVVLIFVAAAGTVLAFGAAVIAPGSVLGARLRALGGQQAGTGKDKLSIRRRIEQALQTISKVVPFSHADVKQLIQAGHRDPVDVYYYRAAQLLCPALGFVVVLLFLRFSNPYLVFGVAGLGFFLPRFILKRMITYRQQRIRLGLPDALDLTVICVEAGLALDQALMRVGQDLQHVHPDLSDEFNLVNFEVRAGKPRAEALRNLVERTGVDDIRALVGTLIQTDRFGTSVAQALRVHSDSLRTERRQRAEEQAAKTTIKMVPPLVIFVLPSIIFVTIGPAVIQLIRELTPVATGR
jgi:tight adherence protein C